MRVAKWGNSLAVRLPASVVSQLDLKVGDDLRANVLDEWTLQLRRGQTKEEAIARMRELSRPLPAGYKFDREEANSRGGEDW
jgi:antitoxin MazE